MESCWVKKRAVNIGGVETSGDEVGELGGEGVEGDGGHEAV
jgi:hypothetical protein